MNIFHALILSVIEGLTEFLPISSTGHLVLASKLLAIPTTDFSKSFDIIIQFGAILAIVSLYWKRFWSNPKLLLPVAFAFLPTAVVGLLLYKVIKDVLLTDTPVIVASLAIGGLVLILLDRFVRNPKRTDLAAMPWKHAVLIGLGQSLAVVPGVSRAAATIVAAMVLGYSRETAVEFSFLLAVPTIGAAAGLEAVKNLPALTGHIPLLAVGFVGSWLTAFIAVRSFVTFVKRHSFSAFGWYRIAIAAAFWLMVGI